MTDNEIHHLMTQSGCGGTLTPAVRRFALACRAAIYSAEQAQIEAPLRAEMQVLKHQRDDLRDALVKVLEAHEREAKATMSYQNARENFSDSADERMAHERAMLAACVRLDLLLTLRDGA